MEKVINYLKAQQKIDNNSIQKFKEEVTKYDNQNPNEHIWDTISDFIDKAGNDNDKFLMLLEEDYKDLSNHLFNSQVAVLDDFNSDTDQEHSDREDDRREQIILRNNQAHTNKTNSTEHDSKQEKIKSNESILKKEDNYNEDNIYDDEQDDNIQDRWYLRQNRDDSEERDKDSGDESSYDPLDTNKIKSAEDSKPISNKNYANYPMIYPGNSQMKGGQKLPANSQKNTFDPRILDQNAKIMQMMAQNPQFKGNYPMAFPMMHPMQSNNAYMMNNMPTQMMPKVQHQAKPTNQGKSNYNQLNLTN